MSVGCYKCTKKFGLLRKEYGCSACGFAFCSQCLTEKMVVAKVDSTRKVPVCFNCFKLATSPVVPTPVRLNQVLSNSATIAVDYRKQNDQNATEELTERLRKLKDSENIPSQADLTVRLDQLRGLEPSTSRNLPRSVPPVDRRTTEQKTADLLNQMSDEVKLDRQTATPFDDIEERLARLKGLPVGPKSEVGKSGSEIPTLPPSIIQVPTDELSPLTLGAEVDEVEKLLLEASKDANRSAAQYLRNLSEDPIAMEAYRKALASGKKPKEKDVAKSDDSDAEDDVDAERLAKQLVDESLSEETPNSDEQPDYLFCCICFDDATVKSSTNGKFYCTGCYQELKPA